MSLSFNAKLIIMHLTYTLVAEIYHSGICDINVAKDGETSYYLLVPHNNRGNNRSYDLACLVNESALSREDKSTVLKQLGLN
jgi:hypothetical protein